MAEVERRGLRGVADHLGADRATAPAGHPKRDVVSVHSGSLDKQSDGRTSRLRGRCDLDPANGRVARVAGVRRVKFKRPHIGDLRNNLDVGNDRPDPGLHACPASAAGGWEQHPALRQGGARRGWAAAELEDHTRKRVRLRARARNEDASRASAGEDKAGPAGRGRDHDMEVRHSRPIAEDRKHLPGLRGPSHGRERGRPLSGADDVDRVGGGVCRRVRVAGRWRGPGVTDHHRVPLRVVGGGLGGRERRLQIRLQGAGAVLRGDRVDAERRAGGRGCGQAAEARAGDGGQRDSAER